jgi:hypothetical protein
VAKNYDDKGEPAKLAYETPKIVSIDLLADEVLALGCKTITGGGKFSPVVHCANQNCINIGS